MYKVYFEIECDGSCKGCGLDTCPHYPIKNKDKNESK